MNRLRRATLRRMGWTATGLRARKAKHDGKHGGIGVGHLGQRKALHDMF